MIWYLIVCTLGSGGHCLPLQQMKDLRECRFVAAQYRTIVDDSSYVNRVRCIALRK